MSWLLLLLTGGMVMHPARQTICELEWNAETGRVEVAIRLSAMEEQQLLKSFSERLSDQNTVAAKKLVPLILAQRMRFSATPEFTDPEPLDSQRYHYVGRKPEGYHVWWFVEVVPPVAGKAPKHLRYTLLDADPKSHPRGGWDQPHSEIHHTIVLQSGGQPKSVALTEHTTHAELNWRSGS